MICPGCYKLVHGDWHVCPEPPKGHARWVHDPAVGWWPLYPATSTGHAPSPEALRQIASVFTRLANDYERQATR